MLFPVSQTCFWAGKNPNPNPPAPLLPGTSSHRYHRPADAVAWELPRAAHSCRGPSGQRRGTGLQGNAQLQGKKKGRKKNKKEGFLQQFTKLKGMPSTSVYEAQYLEEGESGNRLLMVLS